MGEGMVRKTVLSLYPCPLSEQIAIKLAMLWRSQKFSSRTRQKSQFLWTSLPLSRMRRALSSPVSLFCMSRQYGPETTSYCSSWWEFSCLPLGYQRHLAANNTFYPKLDNMLYALACYFPHSFQQCEKAPTLPPHPISKTREAQWISA